MKQITLLLIFSFSTFTYAIRNGSETSLSTTPWQVSLQYFKAEQWNHFCGGSIIQATGEIEKRVILTSASCVSGISPEDLKNNKVRVAAGNDGNKEDLITLPSIEKIYYHSTYHTSQREFESFLKSVTLKFSYLEAKKDGDITTEELHQYMQYKELLDISQRGSGPVIADIAVLVLSKDIEESVPNNIQAVDIDLGEEISNDNMDHHGREVLVAGWGKTHAQATPNQLQLTNLFIEQCDPNQLICEKYINSNFSETQLYLENKNKGPWHGDGGGAAVMMSTITKEPKIIGIVSYGAQNLKTASISGGFFTKLSAYADWLFPILTEEKELYNVAEINSSIDPQESPFGVIIH